MTELARGSVGDRPWGLTLGALGLRGVTGQLILAEGGKRYQIAFDGGAVINALSPLASDAAVRIAMTGGLLSSTQVADIARRQQANPQRDEVDLIAELLRISPDQAMKLRRRVIAQRAARTFSLERGDFVVDDQITLPTVAGAELDIRAVIFLGARTNLSEARISAEIAMFGSWFKLREEGLVDLPQYGFSRAEDPVIDLLEGGAALADLEGMGSEPHVVHAMVYALVSCNAVDSDAAPRTAPRPQPAARPQAVPQRLESLHPPQQPPRPQPVQPQQPPRPQPIQPQPRVQQPPARQPQPQRTLTTPPPDSSLDPPTTRRGDMDGLDGATLRRPTGLDAPTSPRSQMPTTLRAKNVTNLDPAMATQVRALIKKHLELLKKRADHYTLLGTTIDASADQIRKAYFSLARQLHPDRLSALDIADDSKDAQRLFAQVNTAFGVLSDPARRTEYTNMLRRGGEAAVAAEQAKAEELATRIMDAEEAFRRGEAALRRDQLPVAFQEFSRALQLNPDEVDYLAAHTWVEFCSAPDKMVAASKARVTLDRAINKSPRSVTPRFYLGRVERMLGRDADALRHFQSVLQIEPHHREAATEARLIEQRLAGNKRR